MVLEVSCPDQHIAWDSLQGGSGKNFRHRKAVLTSFVLFSLRYLEVDRKE